MLSHRANVAASALFVVMACAAARVLVEVPFDMPLAIHFDAAGNPNRWAPAWFGVSIVPIATLVVLALAALLPEADSRGANLLRSRPAIQTIFLAVLALLVVAQMVIVAHALHIPLQAGRSVATGVSLLFVIGGNVMGKLRWNDTVGIRTPWTAANERVWDQTHRFAGKLFVAVGALMAIALWWMPSHGHENAVVIAGTAIVVVLPALRSYQLWKQQA
jgi:uncharacterized membrane protein